MMFIIKDFTLKPRNLQNIKDQKILKVKMNPDNVKVPIIQITTITFDFSIRPAMNFQ